MINLIASVKPGAQNRSFIVLFASVLVTGCFTPLVPLEPYSPFRTPEVEFRDRISTLCLFEIETEIPLEDQDQKLGDLERQLAAELEAGEFGVVRSAEVVSLWDRVREAEGGYFDPNTGRRVEERYVAIRGRFFAEAKAELGCDAAVVSRVVRVWAALNTIEAVWDGVSELAHGYQGHIGAVSIWISIVDATGEALYFGMGGIQLAWRIEIPAFARPYFVPLEKSEFLSDPAKNLRGLRTALEAVVGGSGSRSRLAVSPGRDASRGRNRP